MDKHLLAAGISLGSLAVFLVTFGIMLRQCDGVLRAYCVDQRLAAVAAGATLINLGGLILTIVIWRSLPTWMHIVGIGAPIFIIGWWIKETIFTL